MAALNAQNTETNEEGSMFIT